MRTAETTGIAYVGCGYVSWFYVETLANHPSLRLHGVFDRNPDRQRSFCQYYDVPSYASLEELLEDPRVQIVVNLTNPEHHFDISKRAAEAGKHIYSEKPLTSTIEDSRRLIQLVDDRGVKLSCAPCTVLSDAARTALAAISGGAIGKPLLAYAELDDGPIFRMNFRKWRTPNGIPWPYRNEFETGCTLEHAAYAVTWLVAMFGAAKRVTSCASLRLSDLKKKHDLDRVAPDFSTGCIEFAGGMVARVTNSIIAPRNHELSIFGESGELKVGNLWDNASTVTLRNHEGERVLPHVTPSSATAVARAGSRGEFGRRIAALARAIQGRVLPSPAETTSRAGLPMDFSRGIAALASSIQHDEKTVLDGRFALHVDEICHALSSPPGGAGTTAISSGLSAWRGA